VLEGAKEAVPDIEQVTKIGIHIQGVPRVVHPVVGRGHDDPVEESEPRVWQDVFPNMDKGAPCPIDEHDEEQQGRVDTGQNANGGPDDVGVGTFEEEMRITDGEVHA